MYDHSNKMSIQLIFFVVKFKEHVEGDELIVTAGHMAQ